MSTKRARASEPVDTAPAAKKSCLRDYDEKTMTRMAKRGDLDGIKKVLDDVGHIPWHGIVQYKAAAHGHLPILQLIYDKYVKGTRGSTCFRDEDEMHAALCGGDDDTIRWMCRHYRELFCLVDADDHDADENDTIGPNDIGRAHGSAQSWLTSAKRWDLSRWAYTKLGFDYDEISMLNIIVGDNVDMVCFAVEHGGRVEGTAVLDFLEPRYLRTVQEYKRLASTDV
ncbi:hypothetical protein psal_cds_814 [Pandoravirus salinus]|uniref:Ankyrin repeat domain containing protein n=1 Tax=Pandoravirus salinus TaxID=1349410 RepID=S4VW17_9VIRU|nr:hypothetical protein psal_cds_814 [Pandoravirus salinus]AGO84844.1 hypothetical protein psal_cds_814 [Pandoravirus salinus]